MQGRVFGGSWSDFVTNEPDHPFNWDWLSLQVQQCRWSPAARDARRLGIRNIGAQPRTGLADGLAPRETGTAKGAVTDIAPQIAEE